MLVPSENDIHRLEMIDKQLWRKAQLRYCPKCDYCDCKLTYRTATIDHIRPVAGGGGNEYPNRALACKPCQIRKGCQTIVASGMTLLRMRPWPLDDIAPLKNADVRPLVQKPPYGLKCYSSRSDGHPCGGFARHLVNGKWVCDGHRERQYAGKQQSAKPEAVSTRNRAPSTIAFKKKFGSPTVIRRHPNVF